MTLHQFLYIAAIIAISQATGFGYICVVRLPSKPYAFLAHALLVIGAGLGAAIILTVYWFPRGPCASPSASTSSAGGAIKPAGMSPLLSSTPPSAGRAATHLPCMKTTWRAVYAA